MSSCKSTKNGDSAQGLVSVPPLLIGGVSGRGKLITVGCDWLSLTMSAASGDILSGWTLPKKDEKLPVSKGFAGHEWRSTLGGRIERHSAPYTASRRKGWGKSYEQWLWRGEYARGSIDALNGGFAEYAKITGLDGGTSSARFNWDDVKVTRIDIAFDFQVEKDAKPLEWRESCRDVWDSQGIGENFYGELNGPKHTAYIGGPTAERRIKFYRKDIRDPHVYPGANVMRLELTLCAPWTRGLLESLRKGESEVCKAAASHVEQLTGWRLLNDGDVPEREKRPKPQIAGKVAALVKQYSDIVSVLDSLDADIMPLVNMHRMAKSERSKRRGRATLLEAKEAGLTAIMKEAAVLLQA